MQPVSIPLAEVQPSTGAGARLAPPPSSPHHLLFLSAQFEGEELLEQHRDTLDFLLAQTDHFLEGLWFKPETKAATFGEKTNKKKSRGFLVSLFPPGDLELLREQREVEKARKKELSGSALE